MINAVEKCVPGAAVTAALAAAASTDMCVMANTPFVEKCSLLRNGQAFRIHAVRQLIICGIMTVSLCVV